MPFDDEPRSVVVQLAVLQQKVDSIACDTAEIKNNLDRSYITRAEFEPIKNLVYGAVALILLSFLTAVIALVVIRGSP